MQCDDYHSQLLEYLDGDLPGAAKTELEAHLSLCPACQEEVRSLRETLALVANMPAPEPPEAFWRQYLREIRQQVGPAPRGPRLWDWFTTPLLRPVPALAAAIVLVMAVVLTWKSSPERLPTGELTTLNLTQQLAVSQDLDILREMEFLEEIELLENWEVIHSRSIEGPRKAT